MRLLSLTAALCLAPMFFEPEGKAGGGSGATLKEQLTKAEKDRDDATARADQAEQSLDEEKEGNKATKASLEAAEKNRDKFKADFDAEVEAHAATKAKLAEEEKKDKTATGKAQEQLARNGIAPGAKDNPRKLATENKADGAALFTQYKRLQGKAKAKFWAANEKALMEFSAEEEKRLARDGEDDPEADQF